MKKTEYYNYIKKHISISDVCRSLNIPLRRTGALSICRCPRHSDEHPSLTIYDDENIYHCFQCGDSGDVFRFVMGQKDCDFHTALNWIEQNFPEVKDKMPDTEGNGSVYKEKNGYEIGWQTYQQMTDEEKEKLHQFAKQRCFSDRQFQAAEVVFTSGGKLSRIFSESEDFLEQRFLLEEKGLLRKVPKERHAITDRYEDYFKKDRVMIPLRDVDGSILGFAGRALQEQDKPKYLFTKGLKKGSFLYRLYNVIHSGKKNKLVRLCLVEGIFDALRLESKGQYAAAVLGNHLTQSQAQVLENSVRERGCKLSSICVFMDSDEAGLQGNYQTIKNILKNSGLRKIPLTVRVLKDEYKDPDEYFSKHSLTNIDSVREYSAFEYLFRYFLKKDDLPLTELDIEGEFLKRSSEEKIYILSQIQNMLPYGDWKEYFSYLDVLGEEPESENALLNTRVKNYIFNYGKSVVQEYTDSVEYFFHMQNAIQVARTSYFREDITLDDWTWDRIAATADVFYPFLYESLQRRKQLRQPLVRLMTPKKRDEQRPKSMYMHEQLIQQQYVLNELLSCGTSVKYENYIPAVRYSSERHSYVTGYQYDQCFEHPVSFAYQVDMDVMNGVRPATAGMFRDFYDCWKDYIYYIQDGVKNLEGDVVYRVKLDISGFYDHISRPVIREVLYPQLEQALRADDKKFKCFEENGKDKNDRAGVAKQTMEWMLDQLFESRYYQASDGALVYKDNENLGIPQGPNISAYIANIVLFPLDKMIQECVNTMNETVQDLDKIRIRYARYVDDMVIVSSRPENLLRLKDMIQSWLFEHGFELSPKTDREDGISKEDAITWTLDERGGLGVSVGFDFPDDSFDSVLDEYGDLETTDRRTLLKILKRVLSDVLYEGIPSDSQNFEELLKVVFQTEEIRLNDIVRFSELMIRKAAEESQKDLMDAFLDIWDEGAENCLPDSLLLTRGLPCYVFLMGCERILMRLGKMPNGDGYVLWEKTMERIGEFFRQMDIIDFQKMFQQEELLKINQNMLLVQLMKIGILLKQDIGSEILSKIRKESEYEIRWKWQQYHVLGNEECIQGDSLSGVSHIQWFHWMVICMGAAENRGDLEEIFSRTKSYLKDPVGEYSKDPLYNCIYIWCGEDTEKESPEYEEKIVKATLFTLLNILPGKLRAECVSSIAQYKHIIFEEGQDMLAVMPGIESPGIMALEKKNQRDPDLAKAIRYDFISESETEDDLVAEPVSWERREGEKELELESQNVFCYKKILNGNNRYVSLQNYICSLKLSSGNDVLKAIVTLYQILSNAICRQMEMCPDKRQIFSQENVLLGLDEKGTEIEKIDLGVTYLIKKTLLPDVAAIRQKSGSYILKQVNSDGAPFWVAGKLLENACEFDRFLLTRMEEGSKADSQDLEMLRYVSWRITGQHKGRYASQHRSVQSYRKGMERVVNNLRRYLKESGNRALYLEDAKVENALISYRMSSRVTVPGNWDMAVWAKRYLCKHYTRLVDIAEEFCEESLIGDIMQDAFLKRRVSGWYYELGARLFAIYEKNQDLKGIRVLAESLWSDAVLMNLRMQVLELIQYLSDEQKIWFQTEYKDLPLEMLDLDETAVFTTQNRKWDVIWNNLIRSQRAQDIKYLTHLGWAGLLGILLEADREQGVIFCREKSVHRQAVNALREIVVLLTPVPLQEKQEFPYEDMDTFLDLWMPANMQRLICCMNQIDDVLQMHVKMVKTSYFTLKTSKNELEVQVNGEVFRKPVYFVSYSKKEDDGLDDFERNMHQKDQICFTCSRKENKLLGISMIAGNFGEALQMWKKNQPRTKDKQEENDYREIPQNTGQDGGCREIPKSDEQDDGYREITENEKQDLSDGMCLEEKMLHKENNAGDHFCSIDQELKNKITSLQNCWKDRKKPFREMDRIALFQFEIDSSYLPPEMEAIGEEELKKKLQEELEKEKRKKQEKKGNLEKYDLTKYRPSFGEYRRRKLLEPVLKACDYFGVEILLLPEYSVRPETVEWMCEHMQDKKYTFSIWAGTFKIPVEYSFESDFWMDPKNEDLTHSFYWNSAALPIILNDRKENGERNIRIITRKFKKYPAVALKEEINPIPAIYDMKEAKSFYPVMEKIKDFDSVNMKDDARKDVTELICAETFAVSNIVNYPSFLEMSLEAYNKYKGNNNGEGEQYKQYKQYKNKMIQDIMNFGTSTSMFSMDQPEEERKHRRSIVLIPACSTRATDYYVIGQSNYLAAGLKTVFCNSVDKLARGGSCFIGQNSWDDTKRRRGDDKEQNAIQEILSENTYYHGLNPGIYQQTSPYEDRGALGRKEQALLICDVSVNEKTSPTAESAVSSLSVVAHVPILEFKTTEAEAKKCSELSGCKKCTYHKTIDNLEKLVQMFDENRKKVERNTMFDQNTDEAQKCLEILGQIYHSDWLKQRGEYYNKYHKTKPQSWPAPALIDWLYVETNYNEFINEVIGGSIKEERLNDKLYLIQV